MSRFTRNFKDIQAGSRQFFVIDAKDVVVGRLASQISPILQGKHKPIFNLQEHDCGDYVIVVSMYFGEMNVGLNGCIERMRIKGI